VRQWVVVARLQLCRRQRRQSHPHHFPRRHPRRHPRHRELNPQLCPRLGLPHHPQRHPDLLIHTIARWDFTRVGMEPSRPGAAAIIISVVSRRNHHAQQIPTIAKTDSQIGRRVGLLPKRSGVAEFMERAARIKVAVVPRSRPLRPLRSRTIARRGLPIGWQVGLWPRRLGAVRTRARAAHRQLEDVPEPRFAKWLTHDLGVGFRAIFWRYWHASPQTSTRSLWAGRGLASALVPSSDAGRMSCSRWRCAEQNLQGS